MKQYSPLMSNTRRGQTSLLENSPVREEDIDKYIKVGKLTPEIKKSSERVGREMALLFMDMLGLTTEENREEVETLKEKYKEPQELEKKFPL